MNRPHIKEARSRHAQGGRRFQDNPALEVNEGYRRAEDKHLDIEAPFQAQADEASGPADPRAATGATYPGSQEAALGRGVEWRHVRP